MKNQAAFETTLSFYDSMESDAGPSHIKLSLSDATVAKILKLRKVIASENVAEIGFWLDYSEVQFLEYDYDSEDIDALKISDDIKFNEAKLIVAHDSVYFQDYPKNSDMRFYSDFLPLNNLMELKQAGIFA